MMLQCIINRWEVITSHNLYVLTFFLRIYIVHPGSYTPGKVFYM